MSNSPRFDLMTGDIIEDKKIERRDDIECPTYLDDDGLPLRLPGTKMKLERIDSPSENYYLFILPVLQDTLVKVWKYTPENDTIVRKETQIMDKVSKLGLTSKLTIGIFRDDFLYLVYQRTKGRTIKELYGKYTPPMIFKSIKQILWMLYNAGIEYPEIIPENFVISDSNYLNIINFERAKIVDNNDTEYKMSEFLHEFLFSELNYWNPHFMKETYKERVQEYEDFDKDYNYVPRDLRTYAKYLWDMDRRKKMELVHDKKINSWEDIPVGFCLGSEHNFIVRGKFENVTVPQLDMYKDMTNNRYYNYQLNKDDEDKKVIDKHKNDFLKSILGFTTDNPEFNKQIPETSINPLYQVQTYNPKFDMLNQQYTRQLQEIEMRRQQQLQNQMRMQESHRDYDKEIEEQFQKQMEKYNTEASSSMEDLNDQIVQFQEMMEVIAKEEESRKEREKIISEQMEIQKRLNELTKKHEAQLAKTKKEATRKETKTKKEVKPTEPKLKKTSEPKIKVERKKKSVETLEKKI
jgi:hypothetical protein